MKTEPMIFPIGGAIVCPDIRFESISAEDIRIHVGQLNQEYKYGMVCDGVRWASKNSREWVVCIAFDFDLVPNT